MGYHFDVFISYRHGHATKWLHDILLPCLKIQLEFSLGSTPTIFTDRDIETGASWPLVLQNAISESKCVIPIFQPAYFESDWCKRELAVILKREQLEALRTRKNPLGLTLPITIGDGNFFPKEAKAIQWIDCSPYYTQTAADTYKETKEFRDFEKFLQVKAMDIAHVIRAVPAWKSTWGKLNITPALPFKRPRTVSAPMMT